MFGCCSAMSLKYISQDGKIDLEALKKHFGATTEILPGYKKSLHIKIRQKVDPNNLTDDEMALVFAGEPVPEESDRTYPLCTCPCHIVGTAVSC